MVSPHTPLPASVSTPVPASRRSLLTLAAVVSASALAAAALAALPGTAQAAEPVRVPTLTVGADTATAGAEFEATVQAVQQSTVAAQVGGNVLQLAVKAGDHVKRGQLLARLDERDAQAGLAQRDAGVAQAEAELRNARTQVERTRELRRQGFISQAALDVAETQFAAATAGTQQAVAARSQAVLARGYASINAPFDGIVLATLVEAGDLATPGRAVLTMYAPGRLRAVVQVPASRSALVRQARRSEILLPGGRWVEPTTRTELPGADGVAQTVEWRLDLPASALEGLQPGQALRARFMGDAAALSAGAARSPQLAVPASAVLRRGELAAVYTVAGTQFVLKAVRVGATLGDKVAILAGLRAGERIALDPVRAGLAGAQPQ